MLAEKSKKHPRPFTNNRNNTMGLASNLSVAVGQRVDLCLDIAVDDGLFNGPSGIVKCIQNTQANQIRTVSMWSFKKCRNLAKAISLKTCLSKNCPQIPR